LGLLGLFTSSSTKARKEAEALIAMGHILAKTIFMPLCNKFPHITHIAQENLLQRFDCVYAAAFIATAMEIWGERALPPKTYKETSMMVQKQLKESSPTAYRDYLVFVKFIDGYLGSGDDFFAALSDVVVELVSAEPQVADDGRQYFNTPVFLLRDDRNLMKAIGTVIMQQAKEYWQ
jgi:hypothetical protein